MRKLVAVENVSLDGVMQAPGRPDEDLRGGFEHGGWALPQHPDANEFAVASSNPDFCNSVRTPCESRRGSGSSAARGAAARLPKTNT